jgi:hypothetical protein
MGSKRTVPPAEPADRGSYGLFPQKSTPSRSFVSAICSALATVKAEKRHRTVKFFSGAIGL